MAQETAVYVGETSLDRCCEKSQAMLVQIIGDGSAEEAQLKEVEIEFAETDNEDGFYDVSLCHIMDAPSAYIAGNIEVSPNHPLKVPEAPCIDADWVVVAAPETRSEPPAVAVGLENPGGVNMTVAAVAGATGFLLVGPLSGVALAAGAACACSSGSLAGDARRCEGSVENRRPDVKGDPRPIDVLRRISGTAQVASLRAKDALVEIRRVAEIVSAGLSSAKDSLSGATLAERELAIADIAAELEMVERASLVERCRLAASLEEAERDRQEQKARLTKDLSDVTAARSEERDRLVAELKLIESAKEEQVSQLTRQLRDVEEEWEDRSAFLSRELENARYAVDEENARLRMALDAVEQTKEIREEEIQGLALELAATERLREADTARFIGDLEVAVQNAKDEESEHNRCCICMDADRQVLFLPCKHVCCCESCAQGLTKCPVDRTCIDERIRFVMA